MPAGEIRLHPGAERAEHVADGGAGASFAAGGPRARLSWRETRARLRADRLRLAALLGERDGRTGLPILTPAYICVFLQRLSHYLLRRGNRHLARMVWHLNAFITGADIAEVCDFGAGLVIVSPAGISMMGSAGRNLTVMALSGLGGEIGRHEDVGAGAGLPLLGDDVVLEPHAGVLGPVRVGSRVRVGCGAMVTEDVPDDTIVSAPNARFIRRTDMP